MEVNGLPDFGAPVPGLTAAIFAPFGGGSYAVLPEQLVVATDAAGQPKFLLEIEQELGDFNASAQFATLDMRLTGDYPLETALTAARALGASATVAPLTIDSGFARLYATSTLVTPQGELLTPVPLGLGGEEGARWTMRLSADAGEILKTSLLGGADGNAAGVVPLGARVEYVASGIAPRVSLAVEFAPQTLLSELLSGNASRMVAPSAIVSIFMAQVSTLPIKILGSLENGGQAAFAQAMEDRLFTAFALLTAAPGATDPATFLFADPTTLDTATIHWDLSQPAVVSRAWVILFDPLASMRAVVQKSGAPALVRYISIPPAPLGLWNIQVTTNLPANRHGVVLLGANLEAPANPPFRPASIDKQLVFSEPDDLAHVPLQLSMREQLQFTITGYAVFADAGFTEQVTAAPISATANWVQMQQGDFPVRFLHLSADPRVLVTADVGVSVAYTLDGKPHVEAYTLTATALSIAAGIPQSAAALQLSIIATPHDGSTPLAIPAPASDRVRIDLTSFAEYGPHTVTISSALASTDPPLFLDLIAQSQLGNQAATPGKIVLTPDAPSTIWSYLALSPFAGGYCYRVSPDTGGVPAAWSKPLSPSSPLVVTPDGSLATADAIAAPAVLLTT